jgi:biotin carboxylase
MTLISAKSFTGKKLLVLGMSMGTEDIIRYAQSEGAHIIFTDHHEPEHSAGKKMADAYWNVSTADTETLEELARMHKVDGIMAGISDFNVKNSILLCEKLNLPVYGTSQQWNLLTNKSSFKVLCAQFNIPVVDGKMISGADTINIVNKYDFPLVLKPVEQSGGAGIRVCNNHDELLSQLPYVLSHSKDNTALMEPYIDCPEITAFYAMQNGKIYLTGLSDRYTMHRQKNTVPLPAAHVFPSIHVKEFIRKTDTDIKKMLASIGVQNGVAFFQGFYNQGTFLFYEMGYRLTGTQEYYILDHESGINPMHMMVHYALTGKMARNQILKLVSPQYKNHYCLLNFLVKPGKIEKIDGAQELGSIPEVIKVIFEKKTGDLIRESDLGTLRQIALRVYVVADTKQNLLRTVKYINKTVQIISSSGTTMLLAPWDISQIQH